MLEKGENKASDLTFSPFCFSTFKIFRIFAVENTGSRNSD